VFANNTGVPLISVFADITAVDGTIINVFPVLSDNSNQCQTSLSLRGVDPLEYLGFWNSTRIIGAWNGEFNMPSGVPPPFTELIHFAIAGGDLKRVEGSLTVTTESQVDYSTTFCCGQCTPPPPELCPENATVAYRAYLCREDTIAGELNNLTDNGCLAENVMFMTNSSNVTEPVVVPAPVGGRHVVEVSDTGFSPTSLNVNKGDLIEFVWRNGTNSVSSGSCAAPSDAFHSGVWSAPHSFVHTPTTSATYYSRTECAFEGSFTIVG
jgi:plastocyanin